MLKSCLPLFRTQAKLLSAVASPCWCRAAYIMIMPLSYADMVAMHHGRGLAAGPA